MRLLLDTPAFLWFVLDDPQLSQTARSLISDPGNHAEISPAVYWFQRARDSDKPIRDITHRTAPCWTSDAFRFTTETRLIVCL
jgi:PIN domain nuclease of toxin-antitoxin system